MKQLLLLLLTCSTFYSRAQGYKNALYAEYKKMYAAEETDAFKGGFTKPTVAALVFSVNNPVMREAMKASGMEDSLAIVTLGRDIQARFFDNDYLLMSIPGYNEAMLPLLQMYKEEMCDCMNEAISKATNKPFSSNLFWAISNCVQKKNVRRKMLDFKVTDIDPALRTRIELAAPYLYVHCKTLHDGLVEEAVTEARNNYLWHKRTVLSNLEEHLLTAVKTGKGDSLQSYFPEKEDLKGITKQLAKINARITTLTATDNELQYLVHSADTKMMYDFAYNGPEPEILGGIELFTDWQQGQLVIKKYRHYSADKVKRGGAFLELLRRRTAK